MCVDLYENALNNNMVLDTAMFSIPTNKIINRYIRHLKANEKNAIRLLSVLDFFSNELALFILVRENLFLSEDRWIIFLKNQSLSFWMNINIFIK